MDSVGLGIFTVVGVNTGIRQGYMDNVFLLVFLGTITGVGGGLLRDMMASVPPYIFVKHIYACASIIGAVVCVYMNRFVGNVQAMVVSSIVVVLIRYLAAHYRWNLPRLSPVSYTHLTLPSTSRRQRQMCIRDSCLTVFLFEEENY